MRTKTIGVGLVGVSPDRGWATQAHLPALAALPQLRPVAVVARRIEGAQAVAARWNVPHFFDDPQDLMDCPAVDLVVVTVKTPDHASLVRAAAQAGKHIYCEWPLGVDLAEARELAALAERQGVHHLIGTQAWEAPGPAHVDDAIRRGVIGRVNAVSMVLLTPTIGGINVPASLAYTTDTRSGTNLGTTTTGHALAALSRAVGDLTEVAAFSAVLHPDVSVEGTGTATANDAPNEVAIIGRLSDGQPVTIAVHGGTPLSAPRFHLHIVGTDGALIVRPATLGDSIGVGDWIVTHARMDGSSQELPVPDDTQDGVESGPPKNVARMYARLAVAINGGPRVVSDFAMAMRLHEVVDAIQRSASTRTVQPVHRM